MKNRLLNIFAIGTVTALLLSGCGLSSEQLIDTGIESYNNGEYSDAENFFQSAISKDDSKADYYIYLGMAQIECKEYGEAMDSLNKALSLNSSDAGVYRYLGIACYMQNGACDEAIEYFTKAVELSSTGTDIKVDSLKYLAACQCSLKNYGEAIEIYTELIDNCSSSEKAQVYYLRGCVYIEQDEINNAVLDFEESVKLDDSDYQTFCNMYNKLNEAGYEDRAQSYLKRLLDNESTDAITLGKTYYILGDYENAVRNLKKAYNDGNTEAAYYLAMSYEAQNNYTDADSLYQEYMSKNSSEQEIYNQYGAYLINREKYDSALVYIETGLELDSQNARQQLRFNQIVCYEYLGDFEKACSLMEEYIKDYPADDIAAREYEFLKTRV